MKKNDNFEIKLSTNIVLHNFIFREKVKQGDLYSVTCTYKTVYSPSAESQPTECILKNNKVIWLDT